jgi:hypothetical protein
VGGKSFSRHCRYALAGNSVDWLTFAGSFAGSVSGLLTAWFINRRIEKEKLRQSRELQEAQNLFEAGVSSRMAQVAFDNLVEFCKEYAGEMLRALETLSGDQEFRDPLDAAHFARIRQEWALWLTPAIDKQLGRFELRIAQIIGGAAPDFDASGVPVSNEKIIAQQISFLRELLRTEALAAYRSEFLFSPSARARGRT